MKFGLDVHCDADISTAIEQAEHAERLGYDFLTVAEHTARSATCRSR